MSGPVGTSRKPRLGRWKVFGIAFGIFFVLQALWAVATPQMGLPDEPAHVIRAAAAVRGEIFAVPADGDPSLAGFEVPEYIAFAHQLTCYRFDQSAAADCQPALPPAPNDPVQGTTTANLNNPLYYLIVGIPTLFLSGGKAFLAMRLVSILLSSMLLGFLFLSVAQLARRRWTTWASVAAMTPMVLFISSGVNPNGVEITASAALLAALVLVVRMPSPGRLLWERATIVVVSCLLLVTARSIALLWLLLILVVAALLADSAMLRQLRSRVASWVALTASAAACLFAGLWIFIPSGLAPGTPYAGAGTSFVTGLQTMVDRTFEFASAWIGLFGWIDTPAPGLTIAVWTVVLGVLFLAGLAAGTGRARWALIILSAAVFVLPWFLQAATVTAMGYIWQGRYNLAMVVCLVIVAGIVLDDRYPARAPALVERLARWSLWLLATGHFAAFVWTLRRYVIGAGTWLQMLRAPEWQPPTGWIVVTLVFAIALIAATLIALRATRPDGIQAPSPDPQGVSAPTAGF